MKTEDIKDVSYIVFESTISRFDRTIKRLWIVILVLIFMLVGSNVAWLYYESQFEEVTETTTTTQEVKQDVKSGKGNASINDGVHINGESDTDSQDENRKDKKDKA